MHGVSCSNPWSCVLLGNSAEPPPAAKRQCKEMQESKLEKIASGHPCCSHRIFYQCFSKTARVLEHLSNSGQSGHAPSFLPTHVVLCNWVRKSKTLRYFSGHRHLNSLIRAHELTCQKFGKQAAPRVPRFPKTCTHYIKWRQHFGTYLDLKAFLPFMPLRRNQYYKDELFGQTTVSLPDSLG